MLSALGGAAAAWYSSPIAVASPPSSACSTAWTRSRCRAGAGAAIIPATATDQERTRAFAWYNVLQDIGHGVGGLLAALPSILRMAGIGELASFQAAVMVYALLLFATAMLYLRLSAQAEAPLKQPRLVVSLHSRKVLWRISLLLDSTAWLRLCRHGAAVVLLLPALRRIRIGDRRAVPRRARHECRLAPRCRLAAKRIGLVNTMVFTHIPSSLLLVTVAFAPNFWWRQCCSCCARGWWRWTCRRASPT